MAIIIHCILKIIKNPSCFYPKKVTGVRPQICRNCFRNTLSPEEDPREWYTNTKRCQPVSYTHLDVYKRQHYNTTTEPKHINK